MSGLIQKLTAFRAVLALLSACAVHPLVHAQAVDSTISYQGRLDISGMPADGLFDFEAVVFDSLTSGNQVSPILTLSNIEVVEGLVNLSLDFGEGVFNGEQRFLELRVRDLAGGGGLVILEPRQSVLAAPYAISTSKVEGNIIQSGTIGDCSIDDSTGINGAVTFPRPFSSVPLVFLTPDASFDFSTCVTARLRSRSISRFTWEAFGTDALFPCDCIHWLAIGPP